METGAITFVEQHLNGVNGNLLDQDFWPTLSPIKNIATSADGKFLYVTATVSNTVSVYSIDQMTGRLTLVVVYVDGVDGIDGLQGASSLLLSPDGKHLYVSGQKENAVAIFNVNQTTGRLTYLNKLAQGVGGITSLNGVRSLAINPDGKYLYASAISSNAVTAFSRDVSTGLLTVNTVFTNGVGGIADLSAPSGMMMDPLSRNLYVSGQNSASIVVFESPVPAVVLSTNEVTTSNNVAVFLDPTLDIKDADSDNLRSATVKITNGMNTDLLSVAVQNGVSASYDANTRTLSLVGIASLSQYIDILRSLSYTPSLDPSVTPGTTSYRTISISVVDEENNSSADAIISVKINPENKVQTITFPAIADKFYGDPDFNIIAQSSNPLQAITYTSSDIDIAEIVAGLIKIKKAGTVTITATQDANSGFDAAIPVSQTLTVKKAPLGITADAQSKVYGTNDPSLTYQITSGKLIGSDVLTGALARDTGENVGTYAINQGTLNASENYDFTYKKADFDITKASLTVTADPQSKVYGSTDPRLTYQITAGKLIGSDVLTGNLSRVSGEDVGNYTINQGTLNASTNYNFTYQKADFDITKASLTITADPQSKVYGTNDPTLTYQITAGKLIGSDVLTGNLSRVSGENVGSYVINQGTLNASTNYDFTYQNANFDITKAGLTVTADSKSKIYGTNDPTLTYQITAGKLIGSDVLTGNLSRVLGEDVGNYTINQGTLNASTNYNFTYQKADLAITPASLTVTADSKSKVYGTNDPTLTYQITSGKLIGTDQLTGSLARDAGENVGNYPITQGTLAASPNYDFTYKKADFDITKASLTVTADAQSKVYGSTDPALTYQITSGQLIGTDQLTGSLARDLGENVGNYPITQGTLAASPNYDFTYK
ncbi:beta-propeller fold lactonase family protein, partial [Empedobacter falsenii]|uniref:MBG domain-containing protein n=1 Tax=Empedobacter falsenii TaxID=343874 RepID=UPI003A7F8717